jgi:hypothetical protein
MKTSSKDLDEPGQSERQRQITLDIKVLTIFMIFKAIHLLKQH